MSLKIIEILIITAVL